jgi:hypothetical protein
MILASRNHKYSSLHLDFGWHKLILIVACT